MLSIVSLVLQPVSAFSYTPVQERMLREGGYYSRVFHLRELQDKESSKKLNDSRFDAPRKVVKKPELEKRRVKELVDEKKEVPGQPVSQPVRRVTRFDRTPSAQENNPVFDNNNTDTNDMNEDSQTPDGEPGATDNDSAKTDVADSTTPEKEDQTSSPAEDDPVPPLDEENVSNATNANDPFAFPLLYANNLVYQGAFLLPTEESNGSTFAYGGTSLAYNPYNDSIYMAGHAWYQLAAEITIPRIINASSLNELARSEFFQNFYDPSDGLIYTADNGGMSLGDLYVYDGKLYGTAYSYYDADATQMLSHFISPLDIAQTGDASGMFGVGELKAGFVSGYMADIPSVWHESFGGPSLTGQCCIPIVSRTSYGPSVFVFDPKDLGPDAFAHADPLVYYPSSHPLGEWGVTGPYFNGSTGMAGVVFPENSRSVLFFGTHGTGEFCYGTGDECGDPVNNSKGTHAYPYEYQIWAYDAKDLLAAKNGEMEPWEVKPYDVWNFDMPFSTDHKQLGGVAYDAERNRLFVTQSYGDGTFPLVHVLSFQ